MLPPELSAKDNIKDPINVLFHTINGYYPWEVNVMERWY
jgi:hypothetical protein